MGAAHFFGGAGDHQSTGRKAGGQQHDFLCLWAVLPREKKTLQISRDRWLKGGSVCPTLVILSKTHNIWYFFFFFLRGPCPYANLSIYLKDKVIFCL